MIAVVVNSGATVSDGVELAVPATNVSVNMADAVSVCAV